jgi:hypothetical protein
MLDHIKTKAFYSITDENGHSREKGDEVTDYAYNYTNDYTQVNSSVYYFYESPTTGNPVRAEYVTSDDPMAESYTYLKQVVSDVDGDSDRIFDAHVDTLQSKTVYFTEFGKGDEVVETVTNYVKGTAVSKVEYFYGDGTPAVPDVTMDVDDDAMRKTITYKLDGAGSPDGIQQEAFYLGLKGWEYIEYTYSYQKGTEIASRSDYEYHEDEERIEKIETYDLKYQTDTFFDIIHGNNKRDSVLLNINTTTYYYDPVLEHVLERTYTEGKSFIRDDPAKVNGRYETFSDYHNTWGILKKQDTYGVSLNADEDYSGWYHTESHIDPDWGTVLDTRTTGVSGRDLTVTSGALLGHDTAPTAAYLDASGSATITGRYETFADSDDKWGILRRQDTYGVSLTGSGTSGWYHTETNIDTTWGIVKDTKTTGKSGRNLNITGGAPATAYDSASPLATGLYITCTGGDAITGEYETFSDNDDDWGILKKQDTFGISRIAAGISGWYHTVANVDTNWGIVESTKTTGKTGKNLTVNPDNLAGHDTSPIGVTWYEVDAGSTVTGEYETLSDNDDDYGLMKVQHTYGISKVTAGNTGWYKTVSTADDWGMVKSTYTEGKSGIDIIVKMSSIALFDESLDTDYDYDDGTIFGEYETFVNELKPEGREDWLQTEIEALARTVSTTTGLIDVLGEIDEYGTVRQTVTIGNSQRNGEITGEYITNTVNDAWGVLDTQWTKGKSYNSVGVTGEYTTEVMEKDPLYGTILRTRTVGSSLNKRENKTGIYTTNTYNDNWGVQDYSDTSGISQRDIEDRHPSTGEPLGTYSYVTTGRYTTDADYDDLGLQIFSETVGENYVLNKQSDSELSGEYTTTSEQIHFDNYGMTLHSYTEGISYKLDATKVSGEYSTDTDFTEGVQTSSQTRGRSYTQKGSKSSEYTTDSTFDGVYGVINYSNTVGRNFDIDALETGTYTTQAGIGVGGGVAFLDLDEDVIPGTEDIEFNFNPWGEMLASLTTGESYKEGITTGLYTTATMYVDGYTEGSITVGTTEKNSSKTGAYYTISEFDIWGNTEQSTTKGMTQKFGDLRGEYTTESSWYDDWGDTVQSVTDGFAYQYGTTTEKYDTTNNYLEGIIQDSATYGVRYVSTISEYTTTTNYDSEKGFLEDSITHNRTIFNRDFEVRTFYGDDLKSDHSEDRLISYTETQNTEDDKYEGGPEWVTATYAYETVNILGDDKSALKSVIQDDYRKTETYYTQDWLHADDEGERLIEKIMAENMPEDILSGGADVVETLYNWTDIAVAGHMVNVLDYTEATNDSKHTFTYFTDDTKSSFHEDRVIEYTIRDNEFEDIQIGGDYTVRTNYHWGDITTFYYVGAVPDQKTVRILERTTAVTGDSKNTVIYYKLDAAYDVDTGNPNASRDVTKVVYDYILTDSSEREKQSGMPSEVKTGYDWDVIDAQRNGTTKKLSVMTKTTTVDFLNQGDIYNETYYKDDPHSLKPEDRVIDYIVNIDNNYTIYHHRLVSKTLGTGHVINRGIVDWTETHKGAHAGRLMTKTFFKDDPMYLETVFAITPLDKVVVERTEIYDRNGVDIAFEQYYYYDKLVAEAQISASADLVHLTSLLTAGSIDLDGDDIASVTTEEEAWNKYDLDCVIRRSPPNATWPNGRLRSIAIYEGDKTNEISRHDAAYKRTMAAGVQMLDSLSEYIYHAPGSGLEYVIDKLNVDKVYYTYTGGVVNRRKSEMDYSGSIAGEEHVIYSLNYMRDGFRVYSETNYDYDGKKILMLEELINMNTNAATPDDYIFKLKSQMFYKGEEGEELVDYMVSYSLDNGRVDARDYYVYDEGASPTYDLLQVRHYNGLGDFVSLIEYRDLDGIDVVERITKYHGDMTIEGVSEYWYDPSEYFLKTVEVWDSDDKATRILTSHTEYWGPEGDERALLIAYDTDFNTPLDNSLTYGVDFLSKKVQRYTYNTDSVTYPVIADRPLELVEEFDVDDVGGETIAREIFYWGERDYEKQHYAITYEPDGSKRAREVFGYGDGFLEADDLNIEPTDPLRRVKTWLYFVDGNEYLSTETYFKGDIGKEQVWMVKTYKTDGFTVKNVSEYFYNEYTGALKRVVTYKGQTTLVERVTEYEGPAGAEKVSRVTTYEVGTSGAFYDPTMNIWADVNRDGVVNELDVSLLTDSLGYITDVNGDGKYDYKDIQVINGIVRALAIVDEDQAILNQVFNVDLNGDGVIKEEEVEKMREIVDNFIDVDMNGEINGKDIDAINNIISFLSSFDTDGDGESDYDELANGTDPENANDNSSMVAVNWTALLAAQQAALATIADLQSQIYGIPGLGFGILATPSSFSLAKDGDYLRGIPDLPGLETLVSGATGAGIKIALMDTGIDTEKLGIDIAEGYDFTGGVDYTDLIGHGTRVASVIMGEGGIAPEAEIMALKVFDNFARTTAEIVAAAIRHAADNAADILVMPFTFMPVTQIVREAIDYAVEKGVILITAAGNRGVEVPVYSLAAQRGVISVGAMDADAQLSEWSNYGAFVDLLAPWDVVNLEGAEDEAGTSFSAAFMAGIAALMLEESGELTTDDVLRELRIITGADYLSLSDGEIEAILSSIGLDLSAPSEDSDVLSIIGGYTKTVGFGVDDVNQQIIDSVGVFLGGLLTQYESGDYGEFAPVITKLVNNNPDALTEGGIGSITGYLNLNKESVNSAYPEVFGRYLLGRGMPFTREELSLACIIEEIIKGAITSSMTTEPLSVRANTLIDFASLSEVSLEALETDLEGALALGEPVIALIEDEGEDKGVLIIDITQSHITYIEDREEIRVTRETFLSMYKGKVISTLGMLNTIMGEGRWSKLETSVGAEVIFVRANDGTVTGLFVNVPVGQTEEDALSEIMADAIDAKESIEGVLVELKRLRANAISQKTVDEINAEITVLEDDLAQLKNFIESINDYYAAAEDNRDAGDRRPFYKRDKDAARGDVRLPERYIQCCPGAYQDGRKGGREHTEGISRIKVDNGYRIDDRRAEYHKHRTGVS